MLVLFLYIFYSILVPIRCKHQVFTQVEAVVFDKDGTLADSRQFLTSLALLRAELIASNCPRILDELLTTFGLVQGKLRPDGLMMSGTRRDNMAAAAVVLQEWGYPVQKVEPLVQSCFMVADETISRDKAKETPPYPGTLVMLSRLREANLKLGVLSSDAPKYVEQFIKEYKLDQLIHHWAGTGFEDPPKPDPALLYCLCEQLKVDMEKTLIIGDSVLDQQLALNAGAAGFISVSELWGCPPIKNASAVITAWDDLEVVAASFNDN